MQEVIMSKRRKTEPVKDIFPQSGLMNQINIPITDPLGSYTGRPADPYETPVQDADDL